MPAPDHGPFDTEAEARAAALAAAGPPRPGWSILSAAQNRQLLDEALAAAGVQLGAYDKLILAWLAGWEDAVCAVITGWVQRGSRAADERADAMPGPRRYSPAELRQMRAPRHRVREVPGE